MTDFPVTTHIHSQFERTMSAVVNASDLGWDADRWPDYFYILGREGAFNYFSSLTRKTVLLAKVYRDSLGYEIIVNTKEGAR